MKRMRRDETKKQSDKATKGKEDAKDKEKEKCRKGKDEKRKAEKKRSDKEAKAIELEQTRA
jgi:hypothetical protein